MVARPRLRPPFDVPLRRVAVPLVVFTCPPLFLLYREFARCGAPVACDLGALAGFLLLTVLGVPAALVLAWAAAIGRVPSWLAPCPDDATLVGLAAIVAAVDAYLLLSLVEAVPSVVEGLVTPLGLLLGLPLVAVQLLVVAAGNALGEPSMGVQLLAVAVGVALSAVWWYVLSTAVAGAVSSVNEPRD